MESLLEIAISDNTSNSFIFGVIILVFVFSLVSYDTYKSTTDYNKVKKKIKKNMRKKEIEMQEIKNIYL